MLALKLVQIGNSLGFVLPKEAQAKMKVAKGDTVFLTDSPDGYRITPYNPDFETKMEVARTVMRKRRNLLRELAK